MWDETLIESNRKSAGRRTWVTAACAFGFHAAIVIVIIAVSFWYLEAVTPAHIPHAIAFYESAQLPSNTIPIVIRKGTPQGNDKSVAPENSAHIVPQQVTQDNVNPNSDLDLSAAQSSIPFNLDNVAPDGTGPYGDPLGNSDHGFTGGGEVTEPPQVLTSDMQYPVLLKRVQPEYPEIMRRAKVQGIVVLSAVISRTGDVEVKEVLKSLNSVMDGAAVRAVNEWKYHPATLNGRPISVWFTITVYYRLR